MKLTPEDIADYKRREKHCAKCNSPIDNIWINKKYKNLMSYFRCKNHPVRLDINGEGHYYKLNEKEMFLFKIL